MKLLPIYYHPHAACCCYKGEMVFLFIKDKLKSTNFGTDILDNLIKNNGFKLRKPYEDK